MVVVVVVGGAEAAACAGTKTPLIMGLVQRRGRLTTVSAPPITTVLRTCLRSNCCSAMACHPSRQLRKSSLASTLIRGLRNCPSVDHQPVRPLAVARASHRNGVSSPHRWLATDARVQPPRQCGRSSAPCGPISSRCGCSTSIVPVSPGPRIRTAASCRPVWRVCRPPGWRSVAHATP